TDRFARRAPCAVRPEHVARANVQALVALDVAYDGRRPPLVLLDGRDTMLEADVGQRTSYRLAQEERLEPALWKVRWPRWTRGGGQRRALGRRAPSAQPADLRPG